jgi:hypothetical protein
LPSASDLTTGRPHLDEPLLPPNAMSLSLARPVRVPEVQESSRFSLSDRGWGAEVGWDGDESDGPVWSHLAVRSASRCVHAPGLGNRSRGLRFSSTSPPDFPRLLNYQFRLQSSDLFVYSSI